MKKSYRDTEPGDEETIERLEVLEDILEDPDVKSALVEKLVDG